MAEACRLLLREVRLMGAEPSSIRISTNIEPSSTGLPRSGQRQPPDKGAAVYFQRHRRAYFSACDRWDRVEDNLYAIAKDLEAVRGRTRWGVVAIENAVSGYLLPPSSRIAGLLGDGKNSG
jgi:hypothetical protein